MESQHTKFSNCSFDGQVEDDLINKIKQKERELLDLYQHVVIRIQDQKSSLAVHAAHSVSGLDEYNKYMRNELERWAAIGKTDIQTGIMALIRAATPPEN